MDIIYKFLLWLDGVIYNFVRYIYEIFIALTKINLFGMDEYTDLANRVYIVIGLVMLFVLAYSLLKAVINPDNFAKGESSFPKLIQNVVVSLVILAVLPTIFGFVFNVQSALLNQGTITKLILSDNTTNGNEEDLINKGGNDIAFYTFRAFFSPKLGEDGCSENILDASDECTESIGSGDDTLKSIDTRVYNGASFGQYGKLAKELNDDNSKLNYYWPISTIAGGFVLYVLLNFCFDMALRTIKLAFYQIIAPIPVVCRVVPGGKLKDVFSKWVKQIISLFVEVFIRIGAIAFGIKMINIIVNSEALATISESGGLSGFLQPTFVRAILIMAVVMFIKQIPKLLGDLFGLDTGGMKLGLREKLAAGGGLLAASAVGGAAGTLARNTVAAGKKVKEAKGLGNKRKAIVGGVLSAVGGAASGFIRGGNRARGAKNFSDVRKAAGGAVDAATEARGNRAENWARYKASGKYVPGAMGMLQNASNIVWGKINDKAESIGQYFGFDDSLKALKDEQAVYQEGLGFKKQLFELVEDDAKVLTYQGSKKTAQEKDLSYYEGLIKNDIANAGYTNSDRTGFYKINAFTGNREYYKDANGQIVKDLTNLAIARKTDEIQKYDDAIKLVSLRVIDEKLKKGEGKFVAVQNDFEQWQKRNASNPDVMKMPELKDLSVAQKSAIDSALSTNDADRIKEVLDALGGDTVAMSSLGIDSLAIMANDKELKKLSGDVQVKISEKVEEKKKKEGN